MEGPTDTLTREQGKHYTIEQEIALQATEKAS